MHSPLPWERTLWTAHPPAAPGTTYALTDLRVYAVRRGRVSEIALQDVGDVEHGRSRLDRLLRTSTVTVRAPDERLSPVSFRHILRGAALAALSGLLAARSINAVFLTGTAVLTMLVLLVRRRMVERNLPVESAPAVDEA